MCQAERDVHKFPALSRKRGKCVLVTCLLCCALQGNTRGMREQGGTLLPFPPSANEAQSLSESCLHFPFTAAQVKKNRPKRSFPKAECFTLGWTRSRDQITTNLFSLQNWKGLTLLPNLQINHNRTGDCTDLLQSPSTRGTQCFESIFLLS